MGNNLSNQESKICQEVNANIVEDHELNLSGLRLKYFPDILLQLIENNVNRRRGNNQSSPNSSSSSLSSSYYISNVSFTDNNFILFPFDAFFKLHRMGVLRVTEMELTNAGIHSLIHVFKPCDEEQTLFEWNVIFPKLKVLLLSHSIKLTLCLLEIYCTCKSCSKVSLFIG
jgi:hypothetical protein